jgi:hypothetical protein
LEDYDKSNALDYIQEIGEVRQLSDMSDLVISFRLVFRYGPILSVPSILFLYIYIAYGALQSKKIVIASG